MQYLLEFEEWKKLNTNDGLQTLTSILSRKLGISKNKINKNTKLKDLRMDSLDIVEITLAIESEFGIEIADNDIGKLNPNSNIGDILILILKNKKKQNNYGKYNEL